MGAACSADAPHNPMLGSNSYAQYATEGPQFVCQPNGELKPRYAPTGPASEKELPATTLMKLYQEVAAKHGGKQAFMVERPLPPLDADGKAPAPVQWTPYTFKQAFEETQCAAKGFIELGFERFDSVNVWGFNSPEWVMSAFAAGFAGGKVAGLYPTDTPDTAAYKVVHSGGSVVVLEDKSKLEKLVKGLNTRGDAKRIKAFVAWGYVPEENEAVEVTGIGRVPVLSWTAVVKKGQEADNAVMEERINETRPGHCAGLIYTSGTTGEPKAVMISHDNIFAEASIVAGLLKKSVGLAAKPEQERVMSYLPLSHVAGMMIDIVMPLVTSRGDSWTTVYFARPYDLKVGSLGARLGSCKPTVFLGVPLVWEKIADKIRALGASTTGIKKSLATWSKGKGLERARNAQIGGTGAVPSGYGMADKIVLSKIKGALGLDQCKFGMTGAAPIRVDTLEYFGSLGITINEVYGMSECTGACTFSLNEAHQWGSCGFELPGIQVKCFQTDANNTNKEAPAAPTLDTTDEKYMGELCWRSRSNMMGYMANPDMGAEHVAEIEKKTAEAIDSEGWLHSGDKGMITDQGMAKITGRYKELIIGEGGENIAPVPIEDAIKKLVDGVNEVMMIGDKRKYNVCLVTLKAVGANGESPGTDDLDAGAKTVNKDVTKISQAMDDETWIKTIQDAITATNKNAKVVINNAFAIQKFCILPSNFSEEFNELTPTKKLKRKVVEDKYAEIIEKMYKTDGVYIHY